MKLLVFLEVSSITSLASALMFSNLASTFCVNWFTYFFDCSVFFEVILSMLSLALWVVSFHCSLVSFKEFSKSFFNLSVLYSMLFFVH